MSLKRGKGKTERARRAYDRRKETRMFRPLLAALLGAVAVSLPAASTAPPAPALVSGKVSARAISLTSKGIRVRTLFEGSYRFVVTDSAKTQNFHLTGPGVNRKTGIRAKTKATWNLKLTPGKYVYRSDKNRRLRRTFTVKAKVPPA